jgi:hypothetical protein
VTWRDVFAARVPDSPARVADCCPIEAVFEAESVKVAGFPGVTERDVAEAVTPLGRPDMVTETVPEKPSCADTETCTGWLALPCASETPLGDAETVKLGFAGGGGAITAVLPPPQPNK